MKIRNRTYKYTVDLFCHATMEWHSEQNDTFGAYLVQCGIQHLFERKRYKEAEDRMLSIGFMSRFYQSSESIESPLSAWRVIGLEKASQGFLNIAKSLPPTKTMSLTIGHDISSLIDFFCEASMYNEALPFAEWLCERSEISTYQNQHAARLAKVYYWLGRYTEADKYYKIFMDANRQLDGILNPTAFPYLLEYANMLVNWDDRIEQADSILIEILATQRQMHVPIVELGPTLASLGQIYVRTGRRDLAESIFNESIETMEPVLGKKHPHVLNAKHYLAWLWRCQGRYDIAVELFNEVLRLRHAILGADHTKTMYIVSNLAGIYLSTGDYENAEVYNDWALRVVRANHGNNHRETFVVSQRQTLIYKKLGQIEKACKSYLHLWTNATRALGEKNAIAIQLGCQYADTLRELHQYKEASNVYKQILALNPQGWGAGLFPKIKTRLSLATCYRQMQRYQEALEYQQQAHHLVFEDTDEDIEVYFILIQLIGDLRSNDKHLEANELLSSTLAQLKALNANDSLRENWLHEFQAL